MIPRDLKRRHRNFDMAKEVLCLLPKGPDAFVVLSDIVEDLALDAQADVRELIDQLRLLKIKIAVKHGPHGNVASIKPESWHDAQVLAKLYWIQVYEQVKR